MEIILLVPASLALILAAAKAHGREVRLAREAAGILQVDFGRDNGPFVNALWRRDRRRYWTLLPALALAFSSAAWFAPVPGASRTMGVSAALILAIALTFTIVGIRTRAGRGGGRERRAFADSDILWWGTLVAAYALFAAALVA